MNSSNGLFPLLSDTTYRIESELGSGGGGIVYKVWHTRLQKHVVIKELKRGSQQSVETQRNEVEALKNVKSAYLPQVLDFLTEGDRIFTVIEFIEGKSLDRLLENGQKFTQPQVVKWYGQLVSALEAIHKQNVCHRDIKPANIMLTPGGDVCLIDFNAALVSGNDVKIISRSLGYASPEQYEIYEQFKKFRNRPINYGSSNISANFPGGGLAGSSPGADADKTEFGGADITEKPKLYGCPSAEGIDWKRSDIYSLGATMYHLLTGKYPSEKAAEIIPVKKIGSFGEGIVYVIEKSMQIDPANRFASADVLSDAVKNIHKHDTRWKVSRSKRIAASVILPLLLAIFAGLTVFGVNIMAQEKEERFYAAVYDIENAENSSDAQTAYDDALAMFRDRIDPYYAMSKRLWNDGDIDACKNYIEANLGNIAQFQTEEDARRYFGDIYFILGNCYYYKPAESGEPDYNSSKGNFETAVKYVTDNPVYYRDYAISLARAGNVADAEQTLEKARALNLDNESLDLLRGEIAFAKKDYDNAVLYFDKVIVSTLDDYTRYRAYRTSDEIFKLTGQIQRSVKLLADALNRIPISRVSEMMERLADAYVKNGDYEEAIEMFDELVNRGAPQFNMMENLAILLHNTDDFNRAYRVLARMDDIFPNDYRIAMRQAYLEADKQSKIPNANRDYALAKQYYDKAKRLYNANVKPGFSDPEMQRLDVLIEQLREYKWID